MFVYMFVLLLSVSGKTLRCLGNASEVAVNTGPYFNGKISVEGASDESCSLYGNQSSAAQIYTMTINHILCGSKIVSTLSSLTEYETVRRCERVKRLCNPLTDLLTHTYTEQQHEC